MNGSRSNSQRPGGASSLDALNRTIEGLEAKIEDLMSQGGARPAREAVRPRREDVRASMGHPVSSGYAGAEPSSVARRGSRSQEAPSSLLDPLAQIRERQRMLDERRHRVPERAATPAYGKNMREEPVMPPSPAPVRGHERMTNQMADRLPLPTAAPARDTSREIREALLGLRQELKQDIADSLAREINGLRSEMRTIRALAEERRPNDDMRADIARLAESIQQLGATKAPGADALRQEFEGLRSLMDGLAREDSVSRMEQRWDYVEARLDEFDSATLRHELLRLAERLEEVKSHIGSLGDNRTIQALEEKLITVASALEHIGAHMDPREQMVMEQFAGIDNRLDEISRAIAASSRVNNTPDPVVFQRLEDRILGLARQIETLAQQRLSDQQPAEELGLRLEALTRRIEELSQDRSAMQLEERLDQLSSMLEVSQQPVPQPELTNYLADISRKIDALENGSVNDRLADRLELLARRIEEMEPTQPAIAQIDDSALRNLEERLNAVVDRLEDTSAAPAADTISLRNLEDQIANLSALISQPTTDPEVSGRLTALEDYMATSDEYIIEAARQAAETVMDNFMRQSAQRADLASSVDMDALTALSDHLRNLEDFSRNSEERTQRTFEALHETLVQIAGRLDELHTTAHRPEPPMFAQAPANVQTDSRPYSSTSTPPVSGASVLRQETQSPITPPYAAPADRRPDGETQLAERSEPKAKHPIDDELLAAADDFAATMTALPVIEANRAEKKPGKPSLLAGLSKRFLPSKKENKAKDNRQVVEPAPALDPIEVMSEEEDANELLEPGSGAPDVRKILERVRASQQASQKNGGGNDRDDDRSDYIAAARRAAQAAAMELDRTQKAIPAAKAKEEAGVSIFSRFRRPILMAVGAILLVAMAMPLVNTLMSGEKAPVQIEAQTQDETSALTPPLPEAEAAQIANEASTARNPALDAASSEPVTANLLAPASTEAPSPVSAFAPTGDTNAAPQGPISLNAPPAPATLLSPGAEPLKPLEPLEPLEPEVVEAPIVVPDTITPPSLANAARNGDPIALFEVGARYTDGRGVEANFAEAAKWYQLAADKGLAPAQYRLANLYEKGTGLPRDMSLAKRYYEMSAMAGNASAMHNLAVIYASGADGNQDYAKAAEWFEKAADHGVSDSQFNLAILYARGEGVPQNLVASYKWFGVAAKGGDSDAAQKRDEVGNALKPDELERARTEVAQWNPQPLDADANQVNSPDEWNGKGLSTASVDMKKAIRNIQAILNKNGFDAGIADGVMGAKTVAAIKAFETSIGQEPTGKISDKLVNELLARNN